MGYLSSNQSNKQFKNTSWEQNLALISWKFSGLFQSLLFLSYSKEASNLDKQKWLQQATSERQLVPLEINF